MLLETRLVVALCVAAALAVLPLALYLSSGARGRRGWRVRRVAQGRWSYEEKRCGAWAGIPFEEHPNSAEPPYVVLAPSEDTWRTFPDWARLRRTEIIERVQSTLIGRNYVVSARGPVPLPERPR